MKIDSAIFRVWNKIIHTVQFMLIESVLEEI